jgi:hypothetical protein
MIDDVAEDRRTEPVMNELSLALGNEESCIAQDREVA